MRAVEQTLEADERRVARFGRRSQLKRVFYVLRSYEWEPNYGKGLMLEEERSSFESGVSRRLQGQQGLRRPESFKQRCRVSERSRGSEEAKRASCSAALHLGVGVEVARNRPPMGRAMALGRHSPCRGLQAPRHASLLWEHEGRWSGTHVVGLKDNGTHRVWPGGERT